MENVDAFCQTVILAAQLGGELGEGIGGKKARELIAIRKALGMPESRENLKECELCDNSDFRPGVACLPPGPDTASPAAGPAADPAIEAVVAQLTEQLMKQLKK
jgi:L-fuculose-phosphate aldolase